MSADGFEERKLAAILAADVVGFSRMMGADEEGTLRRLMAARRGTVDPVLEGHRGRIFKVMGDGLLVEFPSAVLALRAAMAMQAGMEEQNRALPREQRIVWRIGLHQGDVMVHGADLLGDGVNIAARLEPLAPPGGICISARVREDTIGRVAAEATDGGDRMLKNIARPMRVFFVGGPMASNAAKLAETTLLTTKELVYFELLLVQSTPIGPATGLRVSLRELPLVIGRQAPSDVVLPGVEVSRTHCQVERMGRAVTLTDLRSTNGTYVDDSRLEQTVELRSGAKIRIGPYVLRYAPEDLPSDDEADEGAMRLRLPQ